MQAFRTTALAKFGQGDVLGLSDAQIKPRKHMLDIVSKQDGGAVVKANGPVEFKAGEVIGLEVLPKRLSQVAEEARDAAAPRRKKADS